MANGLNRTFLTMFSEKQQNNIIHVATLSSIDNRTTTNLFYFMMAHSNFLTRFSVIAVAFIWVSCFLAQSEATTVSLTAGPYTNSRRGPFGSKGWSTRKSQLLPALIDDDDLDNDMYKEVEECGVRLIMVMTMLSTQYFVNAIFFCSGPQCRHFFFNRTHTRLISFS